MRNRLLAALTIAASASLTAERLTLTGTVTDTLGKPLEDATVMIYRAGVRQGYSTYCPSCYADCGKRAITDRAGTFTIKSLDANLRFELLVVRDGYTTTFVERVDPAPGSTTIAALKPRAVVDDPARVVRGRVVDVHGRALRDVVVLPQGVETVSAMCIYGTPDGSTPSR
jgi:protocatechuate 3,4-dioxygenase beta subunit